MPNGIHHRLCLCVRTVVTLTQSLLPILTRNNVVDLCVL